MENVVLVTTTSELVGLRDAEEAAERVLGSEGERGLEGRAGDVGFVRRRWGCAGAYGDGGEIRERCGEGCRRRERTALRPAPKLLRRRPFRSLLRVPNHRPPSPPPPLPPQPPSSPPNPRRKPLPPWEKRPSASKLPTARPYPPPPSDPPAPTPPINDPPPAPLLVDGDVPTSEFYDDHARCRLLTSVPPSVATE